MRHFICTIAMMLAMLASQAQTMTVATVNGNYSFKANSDDMTYTDNGETLTIQGKAFKVSDIQGISIDESTAADNNTVNISYNGASASVTVAGNIAPYVTATISGAHVSINQTNTADVDGEEITYVLSGSTTDGEFALAGSYKCTVQLAGLTLTNPSGAAINITNKKRIQLSAKKDTENTLTDGSSSSQTGCIYSKGQIQLQGNGTLNVYGNTKHAIKSGDYITVKNLTLNILSAVKDGISCNEYFLMKSGTVNISGVGDDGIQCDLDGDTNTGETTDHEDEDSGNIYIQDGILTVNITAEAAKGVKAEGDMIISGGTVNVTTTGNGTYDSDEKDAKGCAGLKADGNMNISGGTLNLKSSGTGGKCIKADGTLTISDNAIIDASATGSTYTYSRNYTASPKAIKSDGAMTISGGNVTAYSKNHEAIETKSTLDITGGIISATAGDDAINSSSHMTVSGGYVMGYSTGNDGLDANGNMYIKGGLVYAICSGTPEVALDANTEGGYKLYVQGGTIIAIGGLENGASLTQSCYQSSSWSKNTWYALNYGSETFAFKTPSSGGSSLVVSASSTPTLKSGVTASGTTLFGGMAYSGASVSGGSSVTLSSYTGGNNGGGPGGNSNRPGGGGWGW